MEHILGTFFRQAQFADFELAIFRHLEEGGALTEEVLCELGMDLASSEPYQEFGSFFRQTLEEAEALVALSRGSDIMEEVVGAGR